MKPSRVEALSDGIFAIVMTLLVLELKVPMHVDGELFAGLAALWPKFVSFVVSFALLGIYWIGHHIQLAQIKKMDFYFQWLNLLFLLLISIVPFTTALLGEYPFEQASQLLYGIDLILCGVLLYNNWHYANRDHRLVDPDYHPTPAAIRNLRHKVLLPAAIYLIAVLTSFLNTKASLLVFALGPIVYFIPIDSWLWEVISTPVAKHPNNQ